MGSPNDPSRKSSRVWSQQRFEPIAEVNDFEIEAIEIAKGQVPHILEIHTDSFDLAAPAKRRNTD